MMPICKSYNLGPRSFRQRHIVLLRAMRRVLAMKRYAPPLRCLMADVDLRFFPGASCVRKPHGTLVSRWLRNLGLWCSLTSKRVPHFRLIIRSMAAPFSSLAINKKRFFAPAT